MKKLHSTKASPSSTGYPSSSSLAKAQAKRNHRPVVSPSSTGTKLEATRLSSLATKQDPHQAKLIKTLAPSHSAAQAEPAPQTFAFAATSSTQSNSNLSPWTNSRSGTVFVAQSRLLGVSPSYPTLEKLTEAQKALFARLHPDLQAQLLPYLETPDKGVSAAVTASKDISKNGSEAVSETFLPAQLIGIPSVNFHLWKPCNMRCKFCFATFEDQERRALEQQARQAGRGAHLEEAESLKVVQQLCNAGFSKITFVGGEPMLCRWLDKLIILAKLKGLTTMLVTNGTKLDDQFLESMEGFLDWITLSIDSLDEAINLQTGRYVRTAEGNQAVSRKEYFALIERIHKHKYQLKINTVVTAYNHHEDMSDFIKAAAPQRWKVFQVLPVEGQNDRNFSQLKVEDGDFAAYVARHQAKGVPIVPESNEDMKGTYVMVDPSGRFFDNTGAGYRYSDSMLDVGVAAALAGINLDADKFARRGGNYDWEAKAQAKTDTKAKRETTSKKLGKRISIRMLN